MLILLIIYVFYRHSWTSLAGKVNCQPPSFVLLFVKTDRAEFVLRVFEG